MRLAEISIRRPVFAVMLIAALVVFGLVAWPRIGVDLFPNVEFPIVTVTVVYPGADPVSMESKVADPLEETLNTMSGIKVLRSVNLESVTQVIIQFELEVNADQSIQDVRDRVSAAARRLPAGIDPPVVQKFDVGAAPILSIALSGKLPPRELTQLADDLVKERIQRLGGVGSVDLVGGRDREIQLLVSPAKLAGLGLTVQDVMGALQAGNVEIPAGRIEVGQRELAVKTKGEVHSPQEIADILITGVGGSRVRVGDVAQVVDGTEEARSHSSMDGVSAVALVVRKQSGANTVAVAHAVHAELEKLRPRVEKAGATLSVPTDNAPFIEHSIEDVQFDLWFGALLAVVVIMIFLHDFRATLISALAIPTSVIATMAFIEVMGFTFNNMTMLALSLSIGILVDDAIVVIENIHRHLELGKPAMRAAADATREIGLAVIATTFSIVAVFVPVAVMKGIIGRFFFQFGLTVSFAVLVSLLVSFTLTPMLSSRLLDRPHQEPGALTRALERALGAVDRAYRVVLAAALRHRAVTITVAMISLVVSVFLVTQVKSEFVPIEDRAQFSVRVELPTGTSLETTTRYVEAIADDLRANAPGVDGTFVTIGGGSQGQVNVGEIQALMAARKDRDFHQLDAMAWVRRRYAGVKDSLISANPINPIGGDGGWRQQPVQYNLRGKDMDELIATSNKMIDALKKVPGLVDLDTTYRGGRPELAVEIDRDRAAELGVPVAAIASTLRALVAGDKISELKDGLDLYDVTLRLPDEEKAELARLDNLYVRSTLGQLVPISNVVKMIEGTGPSQIDRQSRQRQITVVAGLEKLPLGEAIKEVDKVAQAVVPDSVAGDYTGMAEVMGESFGYMLIALMLAVIIVYMILAAQFDSFIHPLTIMLSLPLSVIGAFGGLYVSGMTLSIFSMIGVIMLMGLVTKNAILLVDFTNQLRAQGKTTEEALLAAGPIRLRPILMTTLAMIFGMAPVAMAFGEGGEVRAPMAVTVIGGLITSTLLTLVVVPVAYAIADRFTSSGPIRWLSKRIFGKEGAPAAHGEESPVPSADGV
ncbi:MAG: efflux RND transporter permease subunit [Deltaproteobacteria bacterium]|nr:efflux RND transporter permease subunit [Deltaproteobacteria bacterium]